MTLKVRLVVPEFKPSFLSTRSATPTTNATELHGLHVACLKLRKFMAIRCRISLKKTWLFIISPKRRLDNIRWMICKAWHVVALGSCFLVKGNCGKQILISLISKNLTQDLLARFLWSYRRSACWAERVRPQPHVHAIWTEDMLIGANNGFPNLWIPHNN